MAGIGLDIKIEDSLIKKIDKIDKKLSTINDSLKETNFSICNNMLLKYGSIVIKPNSSYEGYDVYKCTSTKHIEEILNITIPDKPWSLNNISPFSS